MAPLVLVKTGQHWQDGRSSCVGVRKDGNYEVDGEGRPYDVGMKGFGLSTDGRNWIFGQVVL